MPRSPSPTTAHTACVAALADLEYEVACGAGVDADVQAARRELREAVAASAPPRPPPRPWGTLASPDFAALAERDARLRPYVRVNSDGRGRVDFSGADAAHALVSALLAASLSIDWWVPAGALVPPISGRMEYIDAVERLLGQVAPDGVVVASSDSASQPPLILDIGCGANLIYCLLAAARGWRAIGLDAHEAGLRGASENLARNPRLAPSITLRSAPSPDFDAVGILQHGMRDGDPIIAATLCNPPFFEDAGAQATTANARSDYGGTPAETVCRGGEAAFVGRIVDDSVGVRDRCVWFSAMVGRKASLKPLRERLKGLTPSPATVRVVHMRQGRTARWVLAWSWWEVERKKRGREGEGE